MARTKWFRSIPVEITTRNLNERKSVNKVSVSEGKKRKKKVVAERRRMRETYTRVYMYVRL